MTISAEITLVVGGTPADLSNYLPDGRQFFLVGGNGSDRVAIEGSADGGATFPRVIATLIGDNEEPTTKYDRSLQLRARRIAGSSAVSVQVLVGVPSGNAEPARLQILDGVTGPIPDPVPFYTLEADLNIERVTYTPVSGQVADPTDYLTMEVSALDDGGGSLGVFATRATSADPLVEGVANPFELAPPLSLPAGSKLAFALNQHGAGKDLPGGVLEVFFQ